MKQKGHQGDVQFKEIAMPQSVTKINKKPIALGEHSGHQHVITGDYDLFEDEEGNVYAAVGHDGAVLQHIHETNFKNWVSTEVLPVADHKPIVLKPDTCYLFGVHKRYNPFAKVWDRVKD